MKTFRKCLRCGTWVETHRTLRKEYEFFCPYCDENMGIHETKRVKRNKKKHREINYGLNTAD